VLAIAGSAIVPSSGWTAGRGSPCTGDLTAAGVPRLPGPRL